MTTTPTTTTTTTTTPTPDRVAIGALIGGTVALLAIILLLASTMIDLMSPTAHAADVRPDCVGRVVVFASGASPCNVNPPQRLDIVGVTRHRCLVMGGSYRATDDRCFRVDY